MDARSIAISEHRLALSQKADRDALLRSQHAQLVNRLPHMTIASRNAVVSSAHRQVKLWEAGRLCSTIYIRAWCRILRQPEHRLRLLVNSHTDSATALLSNTPLGPALRELQNSCAKKFL